MNKTEWQTTTALMSWQIPVVEKLSPLRVGAIFLDMGLGKTRVAIELCCLRQHKMSHTVYVCPVSLKDTVCEEIYKHTTCTPDDVYVFNDTTSVKNVPVGKKWYILGTESLSASRRITNAFTAVINDTATLIVDESSYIRNHGSFRTERLSWIGWQAKYRLIMTGTPLANGIQNLYAQMRFLDPTILRYPSFYSFSRNHLVYSEKYPNMITETKNEEMIHQRISPYMYQVTSESVLKLPEQRYDTHYVTLTIEQRILYERAKEELLVNITVDAVVSSALLEVYSALQHIICGFWNHKGKRITVNHNRIKALHTRIAAIPEEKKIIIWATYHHCINEIVSSLQTQYGYASVQSFHGRLSETERIAQLAQWRSKGRFLVATPASGGYGLTLNESHHTIFYNNDFRYDTRIQAEKRNHRIGQEQPVTYIDIIARDSLDMYIHEALSRKESVVDTFRRLTDLYQRGILIL